VLSALAGEIPDRKRVGARKVTKVAEGIQLFDDGR
jgi:hypothetical protein